MGSLPSERLKTKIRIYLDIKVSTSSPPKRHVTPSFSTTFYFVGGRRCPCFAQPASGQSTTTTSFLQ
nr:unnamed protein product [Callosobruchus analis]